MEFLAEPSDRHTMASLNALRMSKQGTLAIGDLVKILWNMDSDGGSFEVTNDRATILRSVGVDNPAAKVLVEMSRVQNGEVGDGTVTCIALGSPPPGFLLNKVWMHLPQRGENAHILIANTPMDTDEIKVFGSRVKVDNISKVNEI